MNNPTATAASLSRINVKTKRAAPCNSRDKSSSGSRIHGHSKSSDTTSSDSDNDAEDTPAAAATATATDNTASQQASVADCCEVCLLALRAGLTLVPCGHARFFAGCVATNRCRSQYLQDKRKRFRFFLFPNVFIFVHCDLSINGTVYIDISDTVTIQQRNLLSLLLLTV